MASPITETDSAARQVKTANSLRDRDEFYKETYRFFDALGRHRQLLLVAVVAFVALCVAGGIMANRHEVRSEEGRNALFLANKAYDTELKSLAGVKPPAPEAPAADDAKNKDSKEAKAAKEAADKARRAEEEAASKKMDALSFEKIDVDAKFPDAVKKYKDVIAQFDGTRAAHEARLALGTLYYNHGDPAKAVPLFQAASVSATGSFDKSIALESWGYALENDGKYAEAISAFEKAANYAEGSVKGDSLLAIARCHEAMHDVAKARSTYDQILSQLPNTEAAKTAEGLKAKL